MVTAMMMHNDNLSAFVGERNLLPESGLNGFFTSMALKLCEIEIETPTRGCLLVPFDVGLFGVLEPESVLPVMLVPLASRQPLTFFDL